jgi:hypothetical protein
MWIIAIGWIYVVALMAATEATVVAGIMTFFGYCVLPLSILFYLTGSKRRRERREMATRRAMPQAATAVDGESGIDPPVGLLFAACSASSDSDSSKCDSSNSDSSDSDASPDCGAADAGSSDCGSDD